MRTRHAALALALATTATPAVARAQFATIEARAGAAPVVGSYGDALGTGRLIGVGASVRVTPTLSVRADADAVTGLDGGAGTPDLYSYLLGLETQLAPARGLRRAPLQLTASLNGGVTQLRFGGSDDGDARNEFRPSVSAGLRLVAELTRTLGLFAGASAVATLLSDDAAAGRAALADGGTLVVVPVVAGVRIRF